MNCISNNYDRWLDPVVHNNSCYWKAFDALIPADRHHLALEISFSVMSEINYKSNFKTSTLEVLCDIEESKLDIIFDQCVFQIVLYCSNPP